MFNAGKIIELENRIKELEFEKKCRDATPYAQTLHDLIRIMLGSSINIAAAWGESNHGQYPRMTNAENMVLLFNLMKLADKEFHVAKDLNKSYENLGK